MRITFRPLIAEDLRHWTDVVPHRRIQGITALERNRVIGIGGIAWPAVGAPLAFVHMVEDARKYPAAIHRAGIAAMQMIRESKVPLVIAEAQPGNPAAVRWLKRLGFNEIKVAGRTAFVWRREKKKAADVE